MKPCSPASWVIAGILLLLFIAPVTAAVFKINGGTGCVPASSDLTIPVTLTDIPTGLSGLNVSFTFSDPQTAQIVSVAFPDWAQLHDMSPVPADQVWVRMVDLDKKINTGDQEVPIATLSVRGLKPGSVSLTITPVRVEDDAGKVYPGVPQSQSLCFSVPDGSSQSSVSPQSAKPPVPGGSPGPNAARTTYSPLPALLPVFCCILAVVVIHRMRRTGRE